jgi:hypothetical protein
MKIDIYFVIFLRYIRLVRRLPLRPGWGRGDAVGFKNLSKRACNRTPENCPVLGSGHSVFAFLTDQFELNHSHE